IESEPSQPGDPADRALWPFEFAPGLPGSVAAKLENLNKTCPGRDELGLNWVGLLQPLGDWIRRLETDHLLPVALRARFCQRVMAEENLAACALLLCSN